MCNNALSNSKITEKDAVEAYKYVLETIKAELRRDGITSKERKKYNRK